ncbi:hypothetical protein [Methylobacterium soli]|nr:hypothetical protein [Methylobacterium soli]GJE43780.1 hypothetical protein AEGHOMDF_2959 [Methylobacterium soli]
MLVLIAFVAFCLLFSLPALLGGAAIGAAMQPPPRGSRSSRQS